MRYVEGTIRAICGELASVEVAVLDGGCGRCHEVGGCGGHNLSRALCEKTQVLSVPNSLNLVVGDVVCVGLDERTLGKIATRIYVYPLAGILIGAGIGQILMGVQGSITGAVAGFLIALQYAKICRAANIQAPRMIENRYR